MTSAIQQSIFEATLDLARLDRRLVEIKASIDLPPDLDAMQEDHLPHDVNAYLNGIIGCVRADLLSDAINTLRHASEITAADLRAGHLQRWSTKEA